MVFTEYERILKKRLVDGECSTARLPENAERNRFQDVLPYDDTRVELVPTKENNTGYINASHIKVRGVLEWWGRVLQLNESHKRGESCFQVCFLKTPSFGTILTDCCVGWEIRTPGRDGLWLPCPQRHPQDFRAARLSAWSTWCF